ncbi:MAG: hypothetical protein KDN19_07260 [Verrucomicrobiae bacterium]|nr:hypothetical protein [Verrucomicrobiae bacterium]
MKIQAITTLITASAVSFFPALKHDSSPQSAAAVSPEAPSAIAENHWEIIDQAPSGIVLLQDSGSSEPELVDPLDASPEGGFAAGGVVELIESQQGAGEIMEIENSATQVVDTVSTPLQDVATGVSEVRVAEIEQATQDMLEDLEQESDDQPIEGAKTVPVGEPVDIAGAGEVLKAGMEVQDIDPSAGEGVEEGASVEERPAFVSTPFESEEDENTGLADRLVSKVSQAVGGEPTEEEEVAAEPTMGEEENGFWLRAARLNDVFQYLARLGHKQYFHNADLDAANYVVTGHLSEGNPIEQMEELGLMYGITIHEKGNTVYAMTPAQLAQLPTKPFYYQLKYLRPSDIEQIRGILQPMMTPGSGSVDFEPKTNTLIFIDNEQRIENLKGILAELDKPKQQVAIETRILRIKSGARNRIGVDWESVLGDGLTIQGMESLNTLFNLPDSDMVEQVITSTLSGNSVSPFTITNVNTPDEETVFGNITGTNDFEYANQSTRTINSTESQLVLSPLQLQATLRALNTGGLAQQESSPTLITEDNEAGIISIIDRIPIIIATVSETTAGQNITEEVRYSIDEGDPTMAEDPSSTREIGVTVSVTPTILPDDTIRMALRPRSAQIVEFIQGRSGNSYPRVNESTVDTIARVPNGYSLLIGGFYEENESDETKKVPVLGDVPGLNFMFKSTDTVKEHTSLVFVVTPKLYEPAHLYETDLVNREIHQSHVLPADHAWPDRKSPGDNYEPNLGWTVGNALNVYPPTPPSSPLHPDNPVNLPTWDAADQPGIQEGQTMVETVTEQPARKGLLSNLFKKRNH